MNAPDSLPLSRIELILMLAALQSMNALAIDIMLPALGLISDAYQLPDPNLRQFVVTIFVLGMSIGAIFYGSLADRFGRKPVLIAALSVYSISATVCAVSDSFEFMLFARFVQGFSAAAMSVLVNSIARDRYAGDEMAGLMSTVAMFFLVVPVIAPMLGQGILMFAPWHVIYWFLAGAAVLMLGWITFRLPETLAPENVRDLNPRSIATTWKRIIKHRNSIGHVIASALAFGGLFAFLTSSQQVFVEYFQVPELFVFLFAVNAAFMSLCNFLNSRIVKRFGARRVSQTAVFVLITTAGIHLIIATTGHLTLPIFVFATMICMGMVALTSANFQSIAMEPFGAEAGAASSFQTFVRTGGAGVIGGTIGLNFDGSAVPLIAGFFCLGSLALLSVAWAEEWRLFRRPGLVSPN